MKNLGIILGNHLFAQNHIKKLTADHYFMAEDHSLCTDFKYHKHKIIFFLAAMRNFKSSLPKNKVTYFDVNHKLFKKSYTAKLDFFFKENPSIEKVTLFEVEDKPFENDLIQYFKKKKINYEFIKNPMFLCTREDFSVYLSNKKKPFMKTFYQGMRKKYEILIDQHKKPIGGKWSYDDENRKKLPKNTKTPEIPKIKPNKNLKEVIKSVDQIFHNHPGKSADFWLPTTRKESLSWLSDFIKHRLELFGTYQDAITPDSDFVFHSVLSPMINAGLITPDEVIYQILEAYNKDKFQALLNSVEGFIRQVIGWREFVRGIYQNFSEEQHRKNYWKHQRKLTQDWYNGTTGIPPLDDAIQKAAKYSYSHHIERLMVISNMMLLCEIHPHAVHSWFMEMYSDSSEWVMGPNVYGMGQFSDGGIFATKPYICGSNYYRKMSTYPKGDWCDVVDGLYWRFIEKHIDFYKTNPRMAIMVKAVEKLDPKRKKHIYKEADDFIKKFTKAK